MWSRDWKKSHPETASPGDPAHIQSPNTDTIGDAKEPVLTGAWYSCLLRGSARAWQIQKWMLTANHWTDHRALNGVVRKRTEVAEGVCNPTGRTTLSTSQSSQGLNHQPRGTHRGIHGSSCICSRRWPCGASMGEEVLGPVKARCPSFGDCEGKEVGLGELVETHPYKSRRRRDRIWGFWRENWEWG